MKVVAIIPARGGSKRLPRKALYPVLGVPMIKRVFEEAKNSKHLNRIVVSTEDKEIKELCIKNNVEVQDRPEELSEDNVEKMDVIEYATKKLIEDGYNPDIVVSLQPNSPEFSGRDLDNAINFFVEQLYDDHPICEVMSINSDMLQNACFRIMTTKTVFQKTLSTHVGVYETDYIDVHNIEDVREVETRISSRSSLYQKKDSKTFKNDPFSSLKDKYSNYYDFLHSFNGDYNLEKRRSGGEIQGLAGCDDADYRYFVEYIDTKRPKHIVEYGSGWSTLLIDRVITDLDYGAEFISFEDDEYWYNHIKEYNFDINNRVNLVPVEKSYPNGKVEWDEDGNKLPPVQLLSKEIGYGPWVTYVHDFKKIKDVDWVIIDGPYLQNYGDTDDDAANGTLNLEVLLNKFGGPMDVWIDGRLGTQEYYRALGHDIELNGNPLNTNWGVGTNLSKIKK